jgi:CRISPR system Cascade subunit CasD
VAEHLILRLDAPLQAWGDVAMDPTRPTRAFPSLSGLAGLLASALGWRYRDADRTTALQDALRFAVREDRRPQEIRDYQTADLGGIGTTGWTRWGIEKRGGGSASGTQILEKFYLADGAFTVALGLARGVAKLPDGGEVTLDDLEQALRRPARPLFLGRKGCPPAGPLLRPARVSAATPLDALRQVPLAKRGRELIEDQSTSLRVWYDPADGEPDDSPDATEPAEIWDRRDFRSNRFGGSRRIVQALIPAEMFPIESSTRESA